MRIVDAYSYRSLPFISGNSTFKVDYPNDPLLQAQLGLVKNYEESIGAYEYFSDLDRYLATDVKKLYVKGGSSKKVPKQVWNIETTSFRTNPVKFYEKYDTEFEEF